ncbi:semaphorin-5A-like [Ruditapes philippinarum]|uniref:semaphorin-5A-like n=1 Tax=Ruditapes philippinarum TaxID=129788 RepID=UPI00295A9F77|nr:semaphorin-5A-like [Ruditapes philippinarum]
MRSICPSHLTQRVPAEYIHLYGDKCYEFVPYVGGWMYARKDCHRKGGHMLSITNAGEQAFISNLISKGYVITTLWLGLDDRVNEGQFNWDTGVKVNYTNWAPGRNVDPYHDQRDCVVMIVARYGKWDDVDCDALVNGRLISYNWMCQYNFETQVISALPNKPIDGNWSHWHKWSACSVTCGTGSQSRTRDCNNPAPQHGGNFCFGLRSETSTCNIKICPLDGNWSPWHTWSACSVTCGTGNQSRTRDCNNPAPQHGGHFCFDLGTETSTCNIKDCPHWMPFYETAPCSVTCGVGFVQLRRNCSTGNTKDCHGNENSEKPCHLKDCSN